MATYLRTLLVALFALLSCTPQSSDGFDLLALDSTKVRLDIRHAPRIQVYIMMLPDCPACQAYSSILNSMSATFKDKVDFCGIFPGAYNKLEEMKDFQQHFNIKFPLLADPQKKLVRQLHASVAPQAILLSKDGTILYSGRIDDWMYAPGKSGIRTTTHDLQDAIVSAIEGKKINKAFTSPIGCIIE